MKTENKNRKPRKSGWALLQIGDSNEVVVEIFTPPKYRRHRRRTHK